MLCSVTGGTQLDLFNYSKTNYMTENRKHTQHTQNRLDGALSNLDWWKVWAGGTGWSLRQLPTQTILWFCYTLRVCFNIGDPFFGHTRTWHICIILTTSQTCTHNVYVFLCQAVCHEHTHYENILCPIVQERIPSHSLILYHSKYIM